MEEELMSRRGSAQLLLLSFRPRRVLGWTIGVTAAAGLLAGVFSDARDFPLLTQTGLGQMLRQSAWERALAELPQHAPWPWVETSSGETSAVPRLGLSASVVKTTATEDGAEKVLKVIEPAPAKDPHLAELGEVSIGDRIIVKTADGSSRLYQVIGCTVVDRNLAEMQPASSDADPEGATCLTEQSMPPAVEPERKL
jgi:hypothetical protein